MKVSVLMVSVNAVSRGQIGSGQLRSIAPVAADLPCEILVVDNGSTDDSAAKLAEWAVQFPFMKVIAAVQRLPYVEALAHAAASARGDIVLIVDIDEANQTLELPNLIDALGSRDCLHGLRRERPWSLRRVTSFIFNFVYRYLLRHRLRDIGHNHYLMRRSLLVQLLDCVARERLIAFPFAIEYLKLDVVQIPVPCEPAGRSSFGLWRRWGYVLRVFYDCVRVAALRRSMAMRACWLRCSTNASVRSITSDCSSSVSES